MSYGIIIRNKEELKNVVGDMFMHENLIYPCVIERSETDLPVGIGQVGNVTKADILMEYSDIVLVSCHSEFDIASLYGVAQSWSDTAFKDTIGFGENPCFVICGDIICRWYQNPSLAKKSFPWAHTVDVSDFVCGETFPPIDLNKVLLLSNAP